MTELSFLIHLLLDHKLPLKTKSLIKERIQEIESRQTPQRISQNSHISQAPSMQRSIEAMEHEKANPPFPSNVGPTPQTYQAAKALEDRQKLINQALSGKDEPGRQSPRKF